mmetsp:Transcript_39240/g.91007  ORF Transcript_39240/g.91007 Transcript_39240/m.91007 type:complete len:398 (+) Transcript_39240:1040-2233(+)
MEMLLARIHRLPQELDSIEAFVGLGDAELGEMQRHVLGGEVGDLLLSEALTLLLLRQRDLLNGHVCHLRGCFLFALLLFGFGGFLGGLLCSLLTSSFLVLGLLGSLLPRLFGELGLLLALLLELLARELRLPLLDLSQRFRLLAVKDLLLDPRLVLGGRLPHHDLRGLLEVRAREPRQSSFPVLGDKVALDLHDNKVPLQHRRHCRYCPADTHVVHEGQAKAHVRLVVAGAPGVALGPLDPALARPLKDRTVADLCVVLVRLQELVEPIECAFIWQTDRKEHFVLASCWHGRWLDFHVFLGRSIDAAASEGQGLQQVGAKVHLQRHVPVAQRWVQHLALECFRQRLRLADAHAIDEEADGVGVGALGREVEQHCDFLVLAKLLEDSFSFRAVAEVAL